jgi:hypothetical protein
MQVIVHAPRDTNLATPDQSLEPGSDIDAITEYVAVLYHDVADIDADPEAHRPRSRLGFVRSLERLLDLDRAANCIEHTDKFGQHTVPGCIRNPASMPHDQLVDHGATGGQHRHCCFFIPVHQAAVALDIGGKDCRKPSPERRILHLETPTLP